MPWQVKVDERVLLAIPRGDILKKRCSTKAPCNFQ